MKRISDINAPIVNFEDGKAFKISIGPEKDDTMTFKNIMLRSLASFKCNDGEKAMNVMAVGVKLSTCAGDVWEYNDSENNTDAILKEVINMNQFQLSSAILGQLYMKVKMAEAFK